MKTEKEERAVVGQWLNNLLQLKKLNVQATELSKQQFLIRTSERRRKKRWISQPSMVPSWNV